MNIIDKVSAGITASVDMIVDKNRELAQLNRLEAIIRNETDVLNHAYIALGKQYFQMQSGEAEETDMSQICEAVRTAEARLKKAQARYDYIKAYGIPASAVENVEMNYSQDTADEADEVITEVPETADEAEEETGDITIACADESCAPAEEQATVEQKAAEAVEEMKKKHSRKKADEPDEEAASDEAEE